MKGTYYLRFLFDAANAFAKNPNTQSYAYLTRPVAAAALKRYLRPSRSIYGIIEKYDDNQVFDWVKTRSYRYDQLRFLMHTSISTLTSGTDELNVALIDLNRNAKEVFGLPDDEKKQEEIKAHEEKFKELTEKHLKDDASDTSRAVHGQENPNAKEGIPPKGDLQSHHGILASGATIDEGRAALEAEEANNPSHYHPVTNIEQQRALLLAEAERGRSEAAAAFARMQQAAKDSAAADLAENSGSAVARFFKLQVPRAVSSFFGGGDAAGAGSDGGDLVGDDGGGSSGGPGGGGSGGVLKRAPNFAAGKLSKAMLAARGIPVAGQALLVAQVASPFVKKAIQFTIAAIIALILWITYSKTVETTPLYVINPDGTIRTTIGGTESGASGSSSGASGDISSCTFYRGGDGASSGGDGGAKFNIPEWPKLINEIAAKTEVPASVLAAILRVECGQCMSTKDSSFVTNDYDDHFSKDRQGNPVAYGTMQFTPPTFLGVFERNKEELKLKFNKTSATTEINPSDRNNPDSNVFRIYSVKDSVIAAALKARADGGGKYDKEAVTKIIGAYYGGGICTYEQGGKINNYCEDVWKSVDNCRASFSGVEAPPPSQDKQQLHDDILNKFGIDMDLRFDYSYFEWAWRKLWNVSNTRFLELVRGKNNNVIRINMVNASYNQQISCTLINFSGRNSAGSSYPEKLFKVVFIHELGHIIQSCNPDSKFDKYDEVIVKDQYITGYARSALSCTSSVYKNEDYAEMVAYYLNQDIGEINYYPGNSDCAAPVDTQNPFARSTSTAHKQFALEVLGAYGPKESPISPSTDVASCPVDGGKIYTPSYQADQVKGHCGQIYVSRGFSCDGNTRRGKSVDIYTTGSNGDGPNGKDVKLPTINGQSLDWKFLPEITSLDSPTPASNCFPEEMTPGVGCGKMLRFKADLGGGKNWVAHILHMYSIDLTPGQVYPSGTVIGKTATIHTHITLGKNIKDQTTNDQSDPGWLPADRDLSMCVGN